MKVNEEVKLAMNEHVSMKVKLEDQFGKLWRALLTL